jgi:TetR/AcrR family transcriptional regulator
MSVQGEKYSSKKVILGAAMKVFAMRGAAGARIDEIVELSGLNVRMIYHHFGSKDGLYEDVIRNLIAARNTAWPESLEGSTADKLAQTFEAFSQFASTHDFYSRVMLWESAGGWKTASSVVSEGDFFPEAFLGLLAEGKSEGVLKTSLSPRDIFLAMHGQSSAAWKDPFAASDDKQAGMSQESLLTLYKGIAGLS